MKKLSFFFLLIILLNSCGFKEAGQVLRNEKIRTTDEFLVKKREPLVLPPDYEKLPLPSNEKLKSEEANSIEDILTDKGSEQDTKKKKSPLETRIEEELRRGN